LENKSIWITIYIFDLYHFYFIWDFEFTVDQYHSETLRMYLENPSTKFI